MAIDVTKIRKIMQEYEDNQKVMEPPCYEEIIIDLFNLYKKGRVSLYFEY